MLQIIYVQKTEGKPSRLLRKNLANIKEAMVEAQKLGSKTTQG